MPFGLPQSTIDQIKAVFDRYPEIERVVLYGSRAKNTHKPGSDIDLACAGTNLTHATLRDVSKQLDDLLLPYSIDLSMLSSITNRELLDHIKRVGVVMYEHD